MNANEMMYWVLAAVFAYLALRFWPLVKMKFRAGKPLPEEVLQRFPELRQGRHLLYFHSPQCGICTRTTPGVQELAEEHANIHVINVAEAIDAAKALGLLGTPTFVITSNGDYEKTLVGYQSKIKVKSLFVT